MEAEIERWLLAADPAVAWQVQRDLLGRAASTWRATQRRVGREGWGKRLLDLQAPDGTWGGGLYSPKWTSTFYTLRLLVQLGIPPTNRAAKAGLGVLLREGVTETGGVSLWNAAWTDTCVTAMLLHMASHFGEDNTDEALRMRDWLLGEQMHDGGWNCRKHKGAKHSSFHTSISTLECLANLSKPVKTANIRSAIRGGEEFFLEHQLYRSSTTGNVINASFSRLSFPPRWYFDVLRGLDYFRMVNAPWDSRLADPLGIVEKRRRKDGKWMAQNHHTGQTHFRLQKSRAPSPMNTLRALRVLRWAQRSR